LQGNRGHVELSTPPGHPDPKVGSSLPGRTVWSRRRN